MEAERFGASTAVKLKATPHYKLEKTNKCIRAIKALMHPGQINAVHREKLEEFLRAVDLWNDLLEGKLKCAACGDKLSIESIGLIIPAGDNIEICCVKMDCLCKYTNVGESNP